MGPVAAPRLDGAQQQVVAHDSGPLLVLAGPGTGKTTTLVEAVVARVERRSRTGRRARAHLQPPGRRRAAGAHRDPARPHGRRAGRLHLPRLLPLRSSRAYATPPGGRPPRLLSGAEREVRVRELLRGNAAGEGTTRWPAELAPALPLRGFAREVADLLDRARERGLDADGLARLGESAGNPAWAAAGEFLDEYLSVLEAREEVDYAGLVAQATDLLDGVAAELCARFSAVYVDEYQDTDPAQERLLRRLGGNGRLLVAVGDPDQSIYGFRGADVANILEFTDPLHAAAAARPLRSSASARAGGWARRCWSVSRELARRIPLGPLTRQRKRHRALEAAGPDAAAGPEIRLFPTVAEEVIAVADLLRRSHLADGVPWDRMAVLVRSGVRSIPVLRRALVAAGVPVSVASDEVPLARDPALAPLLGALEVASRGWDALTPDLARVLLLSPLGGADPECPAGARPPAARARAGGRRAARPAASTVLVRDAVVDGAPWSRSRTGWSSRHAGCRGCSARRRTWCARGRLPTKCSGLLWDGSGWARRLGAAATASGAAGRAADRDLDAVVGLFEAATRLEDRQPRAGVSALLEEVAAQEIPAAPMEERLSAAGSVRLLTAHRAKGLEWDLVVVAGVQDGVWPDLRRRGSLLAADAVDREGPRPAPSQGMLLAEERRLFYVAVTRARRRLVVTAVSGVDDEAERPSRFLDELGLAMPPVTLAGTGLLAPGSLVARLRRALVAPGVPDRERAQAADRLADLARAVDADGAPLVPAAHPDRWWGLVDPTPGAGPVRPAEERIRVSGSRVASFERCPRAWFLDHEAHAQGVSSSAQGFGSVVHALAEAVATGQLPAEVDALVAQLDTVWRSLPFDAEWQREREHEAARDLLARFLRWHHGNERSLVGAEIAFAADYGDDVRLHGRADRLEADAEGRLVVVDLKTSKYPPKDKDLDREPQLGVYQLAVREGAFADVHPGEPGGAELVQLRKERYGEVKVQPQPALGTGGAGWVDEMVTTMARDVRRESFPARPNDFCDRCAYRTSCPAVDAGQQVVP